MASWYEVTARSSRWEGEIPDLDLEFKGIKYYQHLHGDGSAHLADIVPPEDDYAWFGEPGTPPAVVKVVCRDCRAVLGSDDKIEVVEAEDDNLEIPLCPNCEYPLDMCQCFDPVL